MNDFLAGIGAAGIAGALTVVLWFGTKGGGKAKALGWGTTLFLSMLAASAYRAAGGPFAIIPSLVNDLIGMWGDAVPGYTMAGIGATIVAVLMYVPLTTRKVAYIGIVFFYVASDAGSVFSFVAERIAAIMQSIAS